MTDADDRARLFDMLGKIDHLWQRQISAKPGALVPRSLEALDRQHPLGAHPVIPTTIKLAVALDHLIVWAKVYRELPDRPLPGYSTPRARPMRTRASADSDGRSRPFGRYQGSRLLLRSVGRSRRTYATTGAETRMEQLRAEAATAGLTIENLPETTALVRMMSPSYPAGDVMFWQVASGVLHAQEWASLLGDHTVTREGEPFHIIEHTADLSFASQRRRLPSASSNWLWPR